jgi:uncharacterized protein with HEPN domain
MKDRDTKVINRVITHINNIRKYMKDISNVNDFSNNSLICDAVVFNLMQIGELTKMKFSDSFKQKQKEIEWNKIYGFRNRLVHDYMGVNLDIVYKIVIEDIPKLLEELNKTTH